jgi:hypothetical protein
LIHRINEGKITMKLSAPTTVLFIVSVVIAVLAALAALGTLAVIPIASVWIMAIAFVILALGCLIKGA